MTKARRAAISELAHFVDLLRESTNETAQCFAQIVCTRIASIADGGQIIFDSDIELEPYITGGREIAVEMDKQQAAAESPGLIQ
jgi:hypothetical protein